MMAYCPECGAKTVDGAAFCQECGEALESSDTQERPTIGADPGEEPASAGATATPEVSHPDAAVTNDRKWTIRDAMQGRFLLNSLIGGAIGFAVGGVLAILFFPMYFLGIIAGAYVGGLLYDRGSGALVGAASGVVATVPFIVLATGITGVTFLPGLIAGMGVLAVFAAVFALIVNGVCGVVGGLLGGGVAGR